MKHKAQPERKLIVLNHLDAASQWTDWIGGLLDDTVSLHKPHIFIHIALRPERTESANNEWTRTERLIEKKFR